MIRSGGCCLLVASFLVAACDNVEVDATDDGGGLDAAGGVDAGGDREALTANQRGRLKVDDLRAGFKARLSGVVQLRLR